MSSSALSSRVAGMIVPIITPFRSPGIVDLVSLQQHCRRCIEGGIDVLFALGTTGEFYGLTLEQRRETVRCALDSAQGQTPVVVGISGDSTVSTLVNVDHLRDERISGYVVSTPYFLDYSQSELLDHFRAVRAHVGQPIILYNYPARYRHRIDISTVAALVADGTACSIKDTAGDLGYVRELMEIKGRHPAFRVFPSHLQDLGRASELGIDGSVQALGNLLPEECAAFWALAKRGELKTLQDRVDHMWDYYLTLTSGRTFISALKGAMAGLGWCRELTAAPTRPLDAEGIREVTQALRAAYPGRWQGAVASAG
jgi:dihydrodipicolinate synthase/N-acetylneuraminate lyase